MSPKRCKFRRQRNPGRCHRSGQGRRKVSPDAHRNESRYTGVYTDPQRPTSTKTRVIARGATTFADREPGSGHHLLRIDRESKQEISPQIREHLLDAVVSQLPTSDAIIFADYDKGVVTAQLITGVMKHAKPYGIPIIVDPKLK